MIRNKILSTLAVFSLLSCAGIVAAHAESSIDFVCTDNQLNTKTFNVYYVGDCANATGVNAANQNAGILTAVIDIDGFDGQVSSMTFTAASALSGYDVLELDNIDEQYGEGYATITLLSKTGLAFRSEGNLLGTLTLNLNEGYGETAFELNVSDYAEIGYRTTEKDIVDCPTGIIEVPAFATAPVEPEKDEVETARNDFASYADAAVTTFIAGEKAIADVASKTLTWKLTSTEGGVFEKAATVTTDLNGEGSVIFGLMIVNDDAEDFAKIDSAVLVIE